ncbi:WG repeat-containing protein [Leptospira sp. GIMC2001]|uniref:WG repeat-containing protein n=1 Tax=Leptospira sp. GIMC2001 TaxID=1513297 RepID=UPI00234C02CA|nr:WG repeat-containing protein [Leptospira sp. GIMC2001]WCL48494.1 WG repeat-containing protein [Leptospira sp. GIMC2001]
MNQNNIIASMFIFQKSKLRFVRSFVKYSGSKIQFRNLFSIIIFIVMLSSWSTNITAKDITTYHKENFDNVEFNKHGLASILTKDGWVVINKKLKVVYVPFIYDNGPDFFVEGLSRYIDKDKMGFVNEKGQIVIQAKYDFVYPFEKGKAKFCNGCKSIQEGEHYYMDPKSGTWGTINKQGKVLK